MRTVHLLAGIGMLFAAQAASALNQLDPGNFKPVEVLALQGNYQAQRNIAYGYAATPYRGQDQNPLLACAWYLVILHSGSPKVDAGDVGNVRVYCGRLDADSRAAGTAQARTLYRSIYKRQPQF